MIFSRIIKPIIFSIDEELAHNLSVKALANSLVHTAASCDVSKYIVENKKFNLEKIGLKFKNPLGLAAGFDKNAEALAGIEKLGFGFAEVGTITPKPQIGNPKPRLFRLIEQESIINAMGFNNDGSEIIAQRLEIYRKNIASIILGINVGANKNSEDRIVDYVYNIKKFSKYADYFTLNISSPNTPNLRDLQLKENLANLLNAVEQARADSKNPNVAILLKIAPDLDDADLEYIAEIYQNSKLNGLIISNTTISRKGVVDSEKAKLSGGLSGKLLFDSSTIILAKMRRLLGSEAVIIGVGGVDSAASFLEKIKAGADLVQLYSGMVYKGPSLPFDILEQSLKQMDRDGINHISEYKAINVEKWIKNS